MSDFDDIFNTTRGILDVAQDDESVRKLVAGIERTMLAPKVKAPRKPRQTAAEKQNLVDIMKEFLGG